MRHLLNYVLYGEFLRLPGEFLCLHDSSHADFLVKLKTALKRIRLCQASNHAKEKPSIFPYLATCTHVYVRKNLVKAVLYDGPFYVLKPPTQCIQNPT